MRGCVDAWMGCERGGSAGQAHCGVVVRRGGLVVLAKTRVVQSQAPPADWHAPPQRGAHAASRRPPTLPAVCLPACLMSLPCVCLSA